MISGVTFALMRGNEADRLFLWRSVTCRTLTAVEGNHAPVKGPARFNGKVYGIRIALRFGCHTTSALPQSIMFLLDRAD
jgi:hypothetical protein